MPLKKCVTNTATITCMHGGRVVIANPPSLGSMCHNTIPLVAADLLGAPITGCPVVPSSTTKPCLQVLSITTGIGHQWLLVNNQCLILEQAEGMTDGIPSANWRVMQPGQQFFTITETL